jgi:hypothetical protein
LDAQAKGSSNALWHQLRGSVLIVSLGINASVYILLFYCILGIGLVSLCIVLTIIKKGENVSAPVHPHVLIIVKTHENRVEHILATLQMT